MIEYVKRLAGPFTSEGQSRLPFGFYIFEKTDVYVATASDPEASSTMLVYGRDYDVEMNGDQDAVAGGTVVLKTPIVNGQIFVVGSAVAYTQQMQLTNYSRFPPEIINKAMDRVVVQIQQIVERLGRTLSVPPTSSSTPEQLIEKLLSAQEDARKFADQAKTSAEEAKASELKTAEYAEAATVLVPMKAEIKTVADNIFDVVSTGKAIEDVKAVSSIKAEVVAVGTAIEQVKTVASPVNLDAVKTVASIRDQVVRDAEISAEIVKVANIDTHVVTVSTNVGDVTNVSGNMQDINKVAGDLQGGKCSPVAFSAGRLTDPPRQECTVEGGNIKTVASHIVQVDKVAAAADNGTLDKAANSVETTAQNVVRAEAAQAASEAAQRAAESAQGSAETAASNSASSAALSKKWATQTTAPVEGGLYGAKYYADKASAAQGESSQILDSVKKAGTDAVSAINAAGGTQVKAVQAAGAVQTANAKAQADAAAQSAQVANQAKTAAETAKSGADNAQVAAEAAKADAESAKGAAIAAQGKAETAANTATTKANAAAASAEEAKKYANQAATGQVQADWAETNAESKGFIRNKPDVYLKSETYAKTEVYTKSEVDTKLETSSAGADSVELCQQLIGFHNGYTGESLDYRDYLDHKPQEYLDSFYAFGTAFEGAINAN